MLSSWMAVTAQGLAVLVMIGLVFQYVSSILVVHLVVDDELLWSTSRWKNMSHLILLDIRCVKYCKKRSKNRPDGC